MSIVQFSKRLLWSQIKEMYSNEWVELTDVDWPMRSATPRRATVVNHDLDRSSLVRKAKVSDSNIILFIGGASESVIEFDLHGAAA